LRHPSDQIIYTWILRFCGRQPEDERFRSKLVAFGNNNKTVVLGKISIHVNDCLHGFRPFGLTLISLNDLSKDFVNMEP
jgi:hypothetical protein